MLFRLFVIRLLPVLLLLFCKERGTLKKVSSAVVLLELILFVIAVGEILIKKKIWGIFYVLAALLPHAPFYLFALWMLFRCIWQEWSLRVWRRISMLSVLCIAGGIFAEAYWNPPVLRFLEKILK